MEAIPWFEYKDWKKQKDSDFFFKLLFLGGMGQLLLIHLYDISFTAYDFFLNNLEKT